MKRFVLFLALIVALPLGAHADASTRGRAVAEAADRRDLGWLDDHSAMRMVLRNRQGSESTRDLRRYALETNEPGVGDQTLIVFDAPGDIEGTALLSHTRILDPDKQWLYLPALKRVKRISSRNKSGPFVGSEFAYEDLLSQEVDKYDYRWLRNEPCDALVCEVVERVPRYDNSGYTRQVVWWDTEEHRVQRIEYYDRKDAHLKTLRYDGYRLYEGADGETFWRPDHMVMVNHQTGKSTDLHFDRWEVGQGQQDALFSPTRLKRVR